MTFDVHLAYYALHRIFPRKHPWPISSWPIKGRVENLGIRDSEDTLIQVFFKRGHFHELRTRRHSLSLPLHCADGTRLNSRALVI